MSKLKLDSEVASTAPVKEEIPLIGKIVPFEIHDILNYSIRIGEYESYDGTPDIVIRNDYISISKLIELISEGYVIFPYDDDDTIPFMQQLLLFKYVYVDEYGVKPTAFADDISPTFIIEYKEPDSSNTVSILGYCFKEPIENEALLKDISRNLQELIYHSTHCDNEINAFCAYDYAGEITNITISNTIYVLETERSITNV